jgi:hypothetical protein
MSRSLDLARGLLGQVVTVNIDRPMGSRHCSRWRPARSMPAAMADPPERLDYLPYDEREPLALRAGRQRLRAAACLPPATRILRDQSDLVTAQVVGYPG